MSLDGTEPDKTLTQYYVLFTQAINIVDGAVSHGNECMQQSRPEDVAVYYSPLCYVNKIIHGGKIYHLILCSVISSFDELIIHY